jgi:AraC-like DNA-binding protein
VIFDQNINNTPGRWEEIWTIRSFRHSLHLPHFIETFGLSRWDKPAHYERGNGHDYLGFELIEEGSMLLQTEGGQAVVRPAQAYFLLPRIAHSYTAQEPTKKRFLSVSGPFAADLLRHFGLGSGLAGSAEPQIIDSSEDVPLSAWFDGIESMIRSEKTDPAALAGAWYTLLASLAQSKFRRLPSGRHRALERAMDHLENHLADPIGRSRLAEHARISESHLSRLFAAAYGMGIVAYIESRRLEWAERLLRTSSFTVTDVALQVGFNDPLYFSSRFKKKYGRSPRAYRVAVTGSP